MKKISSVVLVTTCISMLILVIGYTLNWTAPWGYISRPQEAYFNSKLKVQVESGKEKIALQDLTNFEWS